MEEKGNQNRQTKATSEPPMFVIIRDLEDLKTSNSFHIEKEAVTMSPHYGTQSTETLSADINTKNTVTTFPENITQESQFLKSGDPEFSGSFLRDISFNLSQPECSHSLISFKERSTLLH
jgi:hypothetical protein